jgi:hypothetical protein
MRGRPVAIKRSTLRLVGGLRVVVGQAADDATRDITRAWARAWDELIRQWRTGMLDATEFAMAQGEWPSRLQLARLDRLQSALDASRDALGALGTRTGVTVSDAARQAIHVTAEVEPRVIADQLPDGEQPGALTVFTGRTAPQSALDFLVARTAQQITALSWELSGPATEAMRRSLIRGMALGTNPRDMARDMVARVEGQFNGGLTRAINIARTETLDAYRRAGALVDQANTDVVGGWTWLATLDRRTCPSCWGQHGSEHPLTEPGPMDHQQGRCARIPTVLPWSALGIKAKEPPSLLPDAQAKFRALPEADQLQIMGPGRLELLKSGQASWSDLAQRRETRGWRPSYVPTPVSVLAA